MEPLRLFGIPISGAGYYMKWMLTAAQLELIMADVSVVDYGAGKKKKVKKGEYDGTKANPREVKDAAKRWEQKYGDKEPGERIEIGSVFKIKQ